MSSTSGGSSVLRPQTIGDVIDSHASSAEGAKMLRYVPVPADASLQEAVATMHANGVSMCMVVEGSTVVGIFTEKLYKNKAAPHGAFPPGEVRVKDVCRPQIFTGSRTTPAVGAIHDLLAGRVRHVVLLKGAGEVDTVERRPSVELSDVEAVVSMRDMTGFLVGVQERARPPADASAEVREAAASLREEERRLDTKAFGSPVTSMSDVLSVLQKSGHRTSYLNCLVDDDVRAADAATQMADASVAALVVVREDSTLAGIFTTRDFLWKVVAPEGGAGPLDADEARVADLMTASPLAALPTWPVERGIRTMVEEGVRHLPITVDEGDDAFLGLISLADATRFVVKARFPSEGDDETDGGLSGKDGLRAEAIEYFARL